MARYTVRVELHNAEWEDYDELHEAMENEGFSRQITSSDGKTYHLPWAEYDRETPSGRKGVLDAAKRAADTTGKAHSILVTESAGRMWHNLPPA
jgi:hypothetical protein